MSPEERAVASTTEIVFTYYGGVQKVFKPSRGWIDWKEVIKVANEWGQANSQGNVVRCERVLTIRHNVDFQAVLKRS